jgi:putative PIN family toxin of toxin-antitoxin system
VVDPGVLVSALISPSGAPAAIVRKALDGEIDLVVSPMLLAELRMVLERPKLRRYVDDDERNAYLHLINRIAIHVEDPIDAQRISRDPDDDYLIALTRAANALALISGDKDLTTLPNSTLTILTPRAALERLTKR